MKLLPLMTVCFAIAACGGGQGTESRTGFVFLSAPPSEMVLCSFVVGVTTQSEVLDELGEPTHYSGDALGSLLQYWIGSEAELGRTGLRAVLLSFDEDGKLDLPSVQQIPFPQCWRDQLDALEAAERAGSGL